MNYLDQCREAIDGLFAASIPDRRPIWSWAEEHVAAIPYSPHPGAFRIANTPWLREPLEAIADPHVRTVCIQAAVQTGKTLAGELALCHLVANAPGPTLWLSVTDDDAKDQSESRLHKLFDQVAPVRALFPRNPHLRRHAACHFANGMVLWVLGAHNRTNLQRRSIRWILGDECWQWPAGHLAEAEARVTAFGWLGKCVWMSQGGVEGDDFSAKFAQTDRREWTWECPECGSRQPYRWEQVEWSKEAQSDDGEWDYGAARDSVALRCPSCQTHLADSDEQRRELALAGAFVVGNPRAPAQSVGFSWNAMASMSWGVLAEAYLRAKAAIRMGDDAPLQQFYQKRLALPWSTATNDFRVEVAPAQYRLGEPWEQEGAVLASGAISAPPFPSAPVAPLRFLTVDVQMDHFWAVVRSWSATGSSRLLWCARLGTWEDVAELQKRFAVAPALVFVDAGYSGFEVYKRCAEHGWTALIGDPRNTFVHTAKSGRRVYRLYSPRQRVVVTRGRAAALHRWCATGVKDALHRLRRNQDPARGPTWEIPADAPPEYHQHMDSERRVKRGQRWLWERIGKRPNHLWDCEAMQIGGGLMLKLIGQEAVAPAEEETEPPPV